MCVRVRESTCHMDFFVLIYVVSHCRIFFSYIMETATHWDPGTSCIQDPGTEIVYFSNNNAQYTHFLYPDIKGGEVLFSSGSH